MENNSEKLQIKSVPKLELLLYVMMGSLETETQESKKEVENLVKTNRIKKKRDRLPIPEGVAENSDMHLAAELLQVPIFCLDDDEDNKDILDKTTMDMFIDTTTQEKTRRYIVLYEELFECLPLNLGGTEPCDSLDPETESENIYGIAYAWDKENILFHCPRGLCTISRIDWNKGDRFCAGC